MKQELTKEQEERRLKGLRILARIIVRHRLAHPELYSNGASGDGVSSDPWGGVIDDEETTVKEKKG